MFDETNGTYSYSISSPSGYFSSPSSGTVPVNGATKTVPITFSKLYTVTFTESGLPAGTEWYVNLTNDTGYVFRGYSTSSTIVFSLVNGTYTFENSTADKIYAPSSYSGTLTVSGSSVTLPIVTFSPVKYTVTFTESGLASGTWYVNISGTSESAAAGSTITYTLSNGTYSYTVSTSNKLYHPSSYTGSVTVSGITPVSVTFVPTTYTVEFTESGLPSGTPWYVNITGLPSSGSITHDSYNVSLQNGSYTYSISTSDKDYAPNAYSGSVQVTGASTSAPSTSFTLQTFSVTFSESGLASGTWYVNISGTSESAAAGSTITYTLSNGTYSYTVSTSNKLYHPSSYTGSVTVSGITPVSVTFNVKPSTSSPPYVIYALVATIAVVGALVSAIVFRRMHK